ncbi:MAG: efflux RND transporter periplasmic adaptor subunit [Pseudomonadota bacterium]
MLGFVRKFVTLIGTAGILVGGIALVSIMGSMRPEIERQAPEIQPPSVFYTEARSEAVTLDVIAQGEVRPRTDINLTAQVAGQVVSTASNFVNGGAFEKGDTLLRIEDADYQVAVTSAKARVAQAEEALRREEAETSLARKDFEDLNLGEDPSELTLRVPQLAQARANYDAARADLRAAELNLSRTRIRAPFEGRVRERIAGPGQYVAPGAQLGRIFSTDVAEIRLPMTDNDLAKLGLPIAFVATDENPGPEVVFSTVVAGEFREWTGHIERTDGAIDPTTRQLSAIAVVEDPYGEGGNDGVPLTIGLFVDAKIEGRPYPQAFVLPRSALYGRDVVYVVNSDDILEERTVAIISSDRDTITVSNGVRAGERVVTSPLRGSEEGDKVVPTDNFGTPTPESDADADASTTVAATGQGE